MERRELFKILIAGAAASRNLTGQHHSSDLSPTPNLLAYEPRFFHRAEYSAVQRLCDILMPRDGQSPGASEAGVGYYLDTVLLYGTPSTQQVWRNGLRLVDEAARRKFGKLLVDCDQNEQQQVMDLLARNEASPTTDLEKFFVTLKGAVVEGYVLSDAAMREYFGYKGDRTLSDFAGCRDHQS